MTRRLLVLACATLLAPLAHASDCTPTSPATGELIGQGLLDPATPEADRQRLGERLMCSALAGNGISQDVAGSLYRWGPHHPAHVFPEDHAKARDLFTSAAGQGRVSAMLKLAELELADGNPREAMIWVQVESQFYRRRKGNAEVVEDTTLASYYVMLLKRATDALDNPDVSLLNPQIDARLAMLDAQIASQPKPNAALTTNTPPLVGGRLPPQQRKVAVASPADTQEGAYAQYFTEVSPDGRVARSWLIDAYPSPGSGLRLGRTVQQLRWNALADGSAAMRYGLVPVTMASYKRNIHLKSP